MVEQQKKNTFLRKLRYKYRLSIYRDTSFEEVLNLRLTRLNVAVITGSVLLIFLIIVVSIIAYTPVREFIPGYPDENTRRNIVDNAKRLDSLELEIHRRDRYFNNLNLIISGKEPASYENVEDTNQNYDNISFERSSEDSMIRQLFEHDDNSLTVVNRKSTVGTISQVHFFPPIKGMITNSFNTVENHYGTDLVAATNEVVKSTMEGTVIIATWTLETGHIIQIQHKNNIISIYKHNAELLKRVGDYVKVGEPIAIIGNSGELTTGPHLHFELWYNGVPLNPEDYMSFQ